MFSILMMITNSLLTVFPTHIQICKTIYPELRKIQQHKIIITEVHYAELLLATGVIF
jgi:hypothetical protein